MSKVLLPFAPAAVEDRWKPFPSPRAQRPWGGRAGSRRGLLPGAPGDPYVPDSGIRLVSPRLRRPPCDPGALRAQRPEGQRPRSGARPRARDEAPPSLPRVRAAHVPRARRYYGVLGRPGSISPRFVILRLAIPRRAPAVRSRRARAPTPCGPGVRHPGCPAGTTARRGQDLPGSQATRGDLGRVLRPLPDRTPLAMPGTPVLPPP
jgi:hypothetical protein